MSTYTERKMSTQHIERQTAHHAKETAWRQVAVHQHDTTPSWKRYGKGVASLKISAVIGQDGIPVLEVTTSETALADPFRDVKRDTTKEASFTAYGDAALEIFEMLRAAFEPKMVEE